MYAIGEKEYYERQLATLKSFEEVDSVVESECMDEENLEEQKQHERAMKISNYANVVLLAFKVINYFLQQKTLTKFLRASFMFEFIYIYMRLLVVVIHIRSSYCLSITISYVMWQIYATIKSGSLAIAASTLDSLLDLIAGGILWFAHLSMININIYKYPIGKLRVQPVGIIIFAAIMATLGIYSSA